MKFLELGLSEPILRAVTAEGYTDPTPIQIQSIPHVLKGRDLLGCAQTGTGKTAAFALPILQRLSQADSAMGEKSRSRLRALVLSPTRELASQIADSFRVYGRNVRLRHTVIFGGVSQHHQVRALKAGVDVLIATPGRLLDLMNQGFVDLRNLEVFVLDEADRMLDMGFIHDIRRIVAKIPAQRQTLFFSATMPPDIRGLADKLLRNPVSVQVTPVGSTVEKVEQSVYFVATKNKPVMLRHYLRTASVSRALVFTRTKHGADRVVKHLSKEGVHAEAIHGNKSQNARQRALGNFKNAKTAVLVATDIASRGIDIDEISHVVNYDMPNVPETYVHRIGRTGRAGASGIAVSFCDRDERPHLQAIERLIRKPIEVRNDHPEYPAGNNNALAASASDDFDRPERPRNGRGGNRSSSTRHNGGGADGGAGGRPQSQRRSHSSQKSGGASTLAATHHPKRSSQDSRAATTHAASASASNGATPSTHRKGFSQRGRGRQKQRAF